MNRHLGAWPIAVLITTLWASTLPAATELEPGDRICLIGNALAERMQHDGWLETLIQSRFPEHELVFRNLGFSGDEVTTRLRSANFGSPDQHLTAHGTDVVFAFFGFSESFAGEAGLEAFQENLADWIRHTREQRYDGESAPRIVLISPIAHQNVGHPNLPDGTANNARLRMYTQAMSRVAADHDVTFVDLFAPTLAAFRVRPGPWTINGIHLSTSGNRLVAEMIVDDLFGPAGSSPEAAQLERLRRAVVDKNFYWFHRYRTTDGFNVYGGRSQLKYVDDLSNFEVLQREMEILDAMTANRDRRVWAIAQGGDLEVDDSNTPPFIPVKSNRPGPLPGGKHVFLGGEEAIERMTVADGLEVNLFASEEQFPELINPVQMAFDTQGRLWVIAWNSYPHWKPKDEMNDQLLILEDTDNDGRADSCREFAGGLQSPTGFEFYGGGVLVAAAPDVFFLADTNGDDRADVRERVLHGIDSADTHHAANSFTLDPGGALYFQEGTFHQSQIETIHGTVRNNNACVWRFEPRSWRVERYIPFNFANPHGHIFDYWGRDIVHDGTGAVPYHGALFSGHLEYPAKHPKPPQVYQQRTRPCPATEILSSRHFPDEYQNRLLVGNVIGFQGILQYRVEEDGASITAFEEEPMLFSDDPNFRPVDLEIGPDGALYFTDWQNPIIGHMQHHIRDPNRDQEHGRVYRVTVTGRDLTQPERIAGVSISRLLDLLKSREDRVRYRTKIELSGRESVDVIALLEPWIEGLDQEDPDYEHHLLEALWLHQYHHVPNQELLDRLLESDDHRVRAAATRVLCVWRRSVPSSYLLESLRGLAADAHPAVRLEAVRAASFLTEPEAIEIPIISMEFPTDQYLDYTRQETMRALQPIWEEALADGREVRLTSEAGMRYFLRNVDTEQLLAMDRSEPVYLELLFREGLREEARVEAVRGLARRRGSSELRVLLDAIQDLDQREQQQTVVFELVRLLTMRQPQELQDARDELATMAREAQLPVVRQIGYVALMATDGSTEPSWQLAQQSVPSLRDFVQAMPLIPDPSLQAELYPRLLPLLEGLPDHLASPNDARHGTYGRYVRVELPGPRRTLTLAEVEVFSDGENVARGRPATQKGVSHGGAASRGVDGNTSGSYGGGGQTHTPENRADPWWEVDLGQEFPIDNIVIWNRTDGTLGQRLDGYVLRVLDGARRETFATEPQPAPAPRAEFPLEGGGPEGLIRRAAMIALTQVRGRETETFAAIAPFIRSGDDRAAAIRALQRIPTAYWPAEDVPGLLSSVVEYVQAIPVADRTAPHAREALQLGETLASQLPPSDAAAARRQLGELGVRVIRIGTRPHRMAYDVERIVVAAGKPVEFVFENSDLMPHNFVITLPGTLEEVGLLGEATALQPDAAERQYVPISDSILLASRLLQPRESQTLSYTAPEEPGVYPFVCTYPGHWRRMYGALYVVEDVDAFLADPEAYLADNELPVRDPLLQFIRPRTEWTYADLLPALEDLHAHRSFSAGRQLFQVASCSACHKLQGEGNEFGPDLAKLEPPRTEEQLLRSLVEPSHEIEDQYRSYVFELESGRVITGMIVRETEDAVHVIENPLARTEETVIPHDEIFERTPTAASLMPAGLLDRLTRDEILDLLGYVLSAGDPDHALYSHDH